LAKPSNNQTVQGGSQEGVWEVTWRHG
jgi:hypothetical protein